MDFNFTADVNIQLLMDNITMKFSLGSTRNMDIMDINITALLDTFLPRELSKSASEANQYIDYLFGYITIIFLIVGFCSACWQYSLQRAQKLALARVTGQMPDLLDNVEGGRIPSPMNQVQVDFILDQIVPEGGPESDWTVSDSEESEEEGANLAIPNLSDDSDDS